MVAMPLATSCLEEAYPSSGVIADQIAGDASMVESQVNSIPAAMFRYGDAHPSCGYPGIMLLRDAMLADVPVYDVSYDYFGWYVGTATSYLGDYDLEADVWVLYCKLIFKANNVIKMCDPDKLTPRMAGFLGNALLYRAFAYLDMARMYEWRKTGVSALDSQAESSGVIGLTVPIVDESLALKDSYNNPRAPFWKMYRFINSDLLLACKCLDGYSPATKIYGDQTTVYGLLARLWLEIATRFENNPADMTEALAHEKDTDVSYEPLGVKTAKEAWAKAADYAKLAQTGHSALTENEWMNPTTGFNIPVSSWLWCMSIGSDDDAVHSWKSWVPEINPEVQYGVVYPLNAYRMIDANLYSTIPSTDWRKRTWIDPSDAKSAKAYDKYETNLPADKWVNVPAYTGFKFRPAQGNLDDYTIGSAVSIPMMRVEEMMLIEAEARAHSEGVGVGGQLLADFMQRRDPAYSFSAGSIDALTDEIFHQKRIEFWGEGIIYFDYKRLAKRITRGYTGTNFPESHRINSMNDNGNVCRWLNFFITSSEYNYNKAVYEHRNPDPSGNSSYEY